MSILILTALALLVIPLKGSDLFASDIETCKHVSASLGSFVIPASKLFDYLQLRCLVVMIRVRGGNLPSCKNKKDSIFIESFSAVGQT